ncbi:MAG: hypothetical protein ABSD39_13810 [Terriglobales bacterium]
MIPSSTMWSGTGAIRPKELPTAVVPINGVDYHLQDLVLLPWFEDEVPSSAENGWYDFPATDYISVPAVYCKH